MSDLLKKAEKKGINLINLPSRWPEKYEEAAKLVHREDTKNPPKAIRTGFSGLDDMVEGFRPGELVILSGPTKNGKTVFAQSMTWDLAQRGIGSLWFTMEMSWQELTRKFMGMDESMRSKAVPSSVPVYYPLENIDPSAGLTLDWMREVIEQAKERNGTEIVFVDHLHFLLPLKDYNQNVSFLIGSIVREVKKIARDLGVVIVLIAHTKKLENDKAKPGLSDIRDSSFIAQESDFAMMIWRMMDEKTKELTNMACLKVLTNRRTGKVGSLFLEWNGKKFRQISRKV